MINIFHETRPNNCDSCNSMDDLNISLYVLEFKSAKNPCPKCGSIKIHLCAKCGNDLKGKLILKGL